MSQAIVTAALVETNVGVGNQRVIARYLHIHQPRTTAQVTIHICLLC